MKRRSFLILATLLALIPFVPTNSTNRWEIIKATFDHLFPKNSRFKGAQDFHLLEFLKDSIDNRYFDKEDIFLLLDGAQKLYEINNDFEFLKSDEKEKILRQFEQNNDGQLWLSKMMNYGLEGIFCDPIYGGNHNQSGWIAVAHHPGVPRPKGRYGV